MHLENRDAFGSAAFGSIAHNPELEQNQDLTSALEVLGKSRGRRASPSR